MDDLYIDEILILSIHLNQMGKFITLNSKNI